jgi:FMN-dependent NADH-azoreductase
MPTLLDVHITPRGERSRTRALRDAFVRAYLRKHPGATHLEVDLAVTADELPALDEWDIDAKFQIAYGDGHLDDAQARRWSALTELTDQLHLADVVLVTSPMWNFTVPWALKRWIDCVVQGRLTFEYQNGEYRGLLKGRRAVLLATRDGDFGEGTPFGALDFQIPYLKTVLGFMGLDPIDVVIAQPLMAHGPEAGAAALEGAMLQAQKLAQSL